MIYLTLILLSSAFLLYYKNSKIINKKLHRRKNILLNSAWYLFIIVFLGQLGPIIGYFSAFWFDKDVLTAIQKSAGKADLISCATAILAGGTFFLVKEYNSSQEIKGRKIKSILILISSVLGLACIGITAQLLAENGLNNETQKMVHWVIYIAALIIAFVLWIYEEWQGTAAEVVEEIEDSAMSLTKKSNALSKINGMKI